MLGSIPENDKEVAYSLTHLCYNLFGYLPAPILYGVVAYITGGAKSRCGLGLLMCVSLLGVLFLYYASKATSVVAEELDQIQVEEVTEPQLNQINNFLNDNDNDVGLIHGKKRQPSDYKVETLSAFFGRPSILSKRSSVLS